METSNLRHSRADEQQEDAKVDNRGIHKTIVDANRDGGSHSERDYETCYGNGNGRPRNLLALEDTEVCFQTYQEEEEDKTDICNEGEVRNRSWWENVFRETRYATHYGWSENDTTDNLANDLMGRVRMSSVTAARLTCELWRSRSFVTVCVGLR